MNRNSAFRIVAVLIMAVVAAVLLRGLFISVNTPSEKHEAMAEIQVASAALPIGLLLKGDDLGWKEIPASQVTKGQIVKGSPVAKRLLGAVTRRAIDDGATVEEKDVVFPDSPGFLAAALHPGTRAVSVAIDDVTGNAGLILPGDRVDLLLTQRITQADSADIPKVASETILSDVRVIAVGSLMRLPDADANGNAAASAPSSRNARTLTLEVDPRDGEKVTVASRLGQLSLSLRSLATVRRTGEAENQTDAAIPAPVWEHDVSRAVRELETKPVAKAAVVAGQAMPQIFHGGKRDETIANSTSTSTVVPIVPAQ